MAKLFISYSHDDEKFKKKIEDHFSTLVKKKIIKIWQDRALEAGSEFDQKIHIKLENADIILLLISSNFFKSDYCYNIEMPLAMKRHNSGEAVVIPIIISPYQWKRTPLNKLVALPLDAKPITKHGNRDEAYSYICEKVETVAIRLNNHGKRVNKIVNRVQNNAQATKKLYKYVHENTRFYSGYIKGISILVVILIVAIKLYNTELLPFERMSLSSLQPISGTLERVKYVGQFRKTKGRNNATLRYNDGSTDHITSGNIFTIIPIVHNQRIRIIDSTGKEGTVSHEFVKTYEPLNNFGRNATIIKKEAWLRSSPIGNDKVLSNRLRLLRIGEVVKLHKIQNTTWQLVLTRYGEQGFIYNDLFSY